MTAKVCGMQVAARNKGGRPRKLGPAELRLAAQLIDSYKSKVAWQRSSRWEKAKQLSILLMDKGVDVSARTLHSSLFSSDSQRLQASKEHAAVDTRERERYSVQSGVATRRSRLTATSIDARRLQTRRQLQRQFCIKMKKMVSADSFSVSFCTTSLMISSKGRLRGNGPHIQVHAYGAISLGSDGKGYRSRLEFVKTAREGFSAEDYRKVTPMLMDFGQRVCGPGWLLKQDHAPQHTGAETVFRLAAHPAKSPDLNPIETVFDIVKDNLDGCKVVGGVKEVQTAVEEAWNASANDIIHYALRSLPEIMRRVNQRPYKLHRSSVRSVMKQVANGKLPCGRPFVV